MAPSTRCIWLVRSLLGDDIHNPRYIETVATVGYRFVGKVEVFEDTTTAPEAIKEPNGLSGVEKSVGNQKRPWSWVLTGGVALAVCLAATIWFLRRPLPPPRITGYTQITHDGHKKTLVGTDGTRLYFNQMSGPFLPESIAQVAISGGGIAQVPVASQNPSVLDVSPDSSGEGIAGNGISLPNPYLLDVSPDGSRFILGGPNSSAWNVRILGGSARRLPDTVCAAFSPDGDSVAYGTMRDVNFPHARRRPAAGAERWGGCPQTSLDRRRRMLHRLVTWRRRNPVHRRGQDLGSVVERIGASRGDSRLARLVGSVLWPMDP